ncbi:MAG TPA: hypothetical protein PK077_02175 [Akkermansia muciniphila]|uniref:hypothetical protein n=1 Tax=Akkermansia sp. TaxID=1872421 RepID=UPI002580654D|nr:hypothetical protein [Akkermansia sp.]HRN23137.1 hypothetical protein [Akkermansia muciniphila]
MSRFSFPGRSAQACPAERLFCFPDDGGKQDNGAFIFFPVFYAGSLLLVKKRKTFYPVFNVQIPLQQAKREQSWNADQPEPRPALQNVPKPFEFGKKAVIE